MLRDLLHSPIRASAFLAKEIFEILRQPRLVLALVLGPFLILLLVGVGFRNEPRTLRALFVSAPEDAARVEEYASSLGPQLVYMGLVQDEALARARLRRSEVDLVVITPPDAVATIRQNQQATFQVLHNEIDPLQASYVDFIGHFYVEEINRRVLRQAAGETQEETASIQDDLDAARTSAAAMRQAFAQGDAVAALQSQRDLSQRVGALELAAGAGLALLGGVEQTVAPVPVTGGGEASAAGSPADVLAQLAGIRSATNELGATPGGKSSYAAEAERVGAIEADLARLQDTLAEFQRLDPGVMVSPFRAQSASIASFQPRITDFYAPGVLALLLQHLAVTFGALSIVRERQLGALELFRVSPVSAGETLLGKYLSYMLFGALLAAAITLLMRFALGTPMVGRWDHFALVLGLVLFASLGIGFVISLLAQTDSQAVQYAMLVLLASVFFSGFLMALDLIWAPIRTLSWMLPVTYGLTLLQTVMLRGVAPDPRLMGGLALIGLITFVLSWLLLTRVMARR